MTISSVRGRGLGGAVVVALMMFADYHPMASVAVGFLCWQMSRRLGIENSYIMRWLDIRDMPPLGFVQKSLEKVGFRWTNKLAHFVQRFRRSEAGLGAQFVKIFGLTAGYLSIVYLLKCAMLQDSIPGSLEAGIAFFNKQFKIFFAGAVAEWSWMSFNSKVFEKDLRKTVTAMREEIASGIPVDEARERAIAKHADLVTYSDVKGLFLSIASTAMQNLGVAFSVAGAAAGATQAALQSPTIVDTLGGPANVLLIGLGVAGLAANAMSRFGLGISLRGVWDRTAGIGSKVLGTLSNTFTRSVMGAFGKTADTMEKVVDKVIWCKSLFSIPASAKS
jgi:hypothetical protein